MSIFTVDFCSVEQKSPASRLLESFAAIAVLCRVLRCKLYSSTTRCSPVKMVPNRFCLVPILCSLLCGISLMHSLDAQQQCGELDMADSISTIAEMTVKVEAASPLQCAFSCLQRQGCTCLCFSVTTSECYVGDEMTSVSPALTTTASHHCFCRKYPLLFQVLN